jgi:hypothetical protein
LQPPATLSASTFRRSQDMDIKCKGLQRCLETKPATVFAAQTGIP